MTFPLTINTREELAEIARVIAQELRAEFKLTPPPVVQSPAPVGSFMARMQQTLEIAARSKSK